MARRSQIHWSGEWGGGRGCVKEYEDDKKHGKGIFEWPDGRKYICTWIAGYGGM